jgi:ubiquinone/menaquinone biosynthesis C-methylase UbiE
MGGAYRQAMTRTIQLVELGLGIEGMALMRCLFEDDQATVESRLGEIRRFLAEADRPPLSLARDFPERSAADGYAAWAATYDAMPNALIDAEQLVVTELLAGLPKGRALDAACGTGRLTELLVAAGHDTLGVDISPEMLEVASRRLAEATFRNGALHDLPAADGEFDLVTCGLALSHLQDLGPAVAELARVTKPGGRLIFTDMHPMGVAFAGQAAYQGADGGWGFVRNHFHTHSHYLDAFSEAGLGVRRCLEPAHTAATADLVPSATVAREATHSALIGLPLALVWDLVRPDNG